MGITSTDNQKHQPGDPMPERARRIIREIHSQGRKREARAASGGQGVCRANTCQRVKETTGKRPNVGTQEYNCPENYYRPILQ